MTIASANNNIGPRARATATGAYLILGGTGGIGQAVCAGLQDLGVSVHAVSRTRPEPSSNETIQYHAGDVTDFDEVSRCFVAASESDRPVTGVALCVGSILLKPAHLTTTDEWREVLDLNLTSAFAVTRAAGKYMKNGGSVVLLSSSAASIGLANHEAIAATKAGIEGLVRSAAATYAPRSLRFNAVAPGLVRTPLTEPITRNARSLEASERLHPLGRIGDPRDVASAILWLLDPAQSWVTGQVLGVDGGLATVKNRVTA
jgi:NAD(P)-dependent dehydrogenase (short-subunit alcohol dehydrogenase family)